MSCERIPPITKCCTTVHILSLTVSLHCLFAKMMVYVCASNCEPVCIYLCVCICVCVCVFVCVRMDACIQSIISFQRDQNNSWQGQSASMTAAVTTQQTARCVALNIYIWKDSTGTFQVSIAELLFFCIRIICTDSRFLMNICIFFSWDASWPPVCIKILIHIIMTFSKAYWHSRSHKISNTCK